MLLRLDLALEALYVGAIGAVLTAKAVGPLNSLLKYGKVSLAEKAAPGPQGLALAALTAWTVPKHWFFHFYVLSLALSLGSLVGLVGFPHQVVRLAPFVGRRSLSYTACLVQAAMVCVQLARRLGECWWIAKTNGRARMNVTHYLAGLFFYTAITLTVVFQAAASGTARVVPLSGGMVLLVLAFLYLQVEQYRSHSHLALLVKYQLPLARWFRMVYCAHYLQEIGIYICVALTTPRSPLNWLAVAWVVTNLSVSAIETGKFYDAKFGASGHPHRWRIIPYVL